jgi:predicted transposase/invertase (TIGR01784 family)
MQVAPGILFELLGEPAELSQSYEFQAVEIKQLSFRLDGIFLPKPDAENQTILFLEVQFQDDPLFYQRFFGEIFLYLAQHPETVNWRAAVLFSDQKIEPQISPVYGVLIESHKVQRVYLEDLVQIETDSLGIGLVQLIVAKPTATIVGKAQGLVLQAQQALGMGRSPTKDLDNRVIIELIETIMVYKFPNMSRKEVEGMFKLSELKQTRVYQEAFEEGKQEGLEQERSFILRLLMRRVGKITSDSDAKIRRLSLSQLEELGEALLDFTQPSDLKEWLKSQH